MRSRGKGSNINLVWLLLAVWYCAPEIWVFWLLMKIPWLGVEESWSAESEMNVSAHWVEIKMVGEWGDELEKTVVCERESRVKRTEVVTSEKCFIHHTNRDWSLFHVLVIRPSIFLNYRVLSRHPDQWHDEGAAPCGVVLEWGILGKIKVMKWGTRQRYTGSEVGRFLPCMTRMQTCLMCWSFGSLP